MGDDLGTAAGEVHGQAREVLDFWFEQVGPERHFARDDALDAEIAERFGALQRRLLANEAAEWRDDRDTLLAAVIVLDQFSRNLFRGQTAAFAADPLALELALIGIARGDDRALPTERRAFLYMPLMHSEDLGVSRFSLHCFEALGNPNNLKFARDHADVLARYGRYPSRNAALGRVSTEAEAAYLSRPDAGW
ncbi:MULTISPECIES: DUF924 family protein [unclassified Sphingomonas]|uniref:DUF924 family protein n=1 Tax=unclassified Sphingomonas TaxID=196159 RepID=UPI0006FEEBB9|nr:MULTISPECIES: DUF924 family protein [unclassified Sphingomonas]KQM56950.1 hypothetical protein ASE65_13895 [Sphingomonas sp. Leaf16]KQN09322.1 hypothetical protein ASE81_13940 [Sphingomonas sp. Leaf29]KQN17500.1 hypothetical protein ASE83_13875 [Sphingomonas sp. Leaf32]